MAILLRRVQTLSIAKADAGQGTGYALPDVISNGNCRPQATRKLLI
jgi:hypothetical protein